MAIGLKKKQTHLLWRVGLNRALDIHGLRVACMHAVQLQAWRGTLWELAAGTTLQALR